jgi:hypothetical protein
MRVLLDKIFTQVTLARQLEIRGPALQKDDDAFDSPVLRVVLHILPVAEIGAGRDYPENRNRQKELD